MECDVEKVTDFAGDDMMAFIEKRQWKDEVTCTSEVDFGAQFLHLRYLSKVITRRSHDSYRAEVRELILLSRHLKAIMLDCQMPDFDPSQIFETYKELMSYHLTIEMLQIHSGMHSAEVASTFTWRNPTTRTRCEWISPAVDVTMSRPCSRAMRP